MLAMVHRRMQAYSDATVAGQASSAAQFATVL